MHIYVTYSTAPILAGVRASSISPALAAHGQTAELARLNLQRILGMAFQSLHRGGELVASLEQLGLQFQGDGSEEITVVLEKAEVANG